MADGAVDRLRKHFPAAPFYAFGAANVAILFSIAVTQILLGVVLLALIVQRRLRAPLPMLFAALYAAWTLVCVAASPAPVLGLSQIAKFYLLLVLPAGYTLLCNQERAERVLRWTFAAGSVAGLLAIAEFGFYYSALKSSRDFYSLYSNARITGFMGHWQTFSGEQMLVLAMLGAFLLFGRNRQWWPWVAAVLVAFSLLLAFTRGVWLGCLAAAAYLLWRYRRVLVLAIPLALALMFLLAPPMVRHRLRSLADTRADSSNQARLLMWRTGLRMIQQHPIVGVGPNGVAHYFNDYRPPGPVPVAWYGHLHNNYLEIAAERGLPGMALFVAFLLALLRDQRRIAAQASGRYRYLAEGAAAAVVAILIAGGFEYNFSDSEVAMLFLFYVGHGYAARQREAAADDAATQVAR